MGFYGNITNVNKSQFTFDKIYPRRTEMDRSCKNDGVFIGRFVLVEYDEIVNLNSFKIGYQKEKEYVGIDRIYLYEDAECTKRITKEQTELKETWYDNKQKKLFTCIEYDANNNGIFVFSVDDFSRDYDINYRIDYSIYKDSFDSSVWQKVFVEEEEKYVKIADLNSVVPTLDISVVEPTSIPIAPHWDPDSTDVYYKMHLQSNWGFRVASAEDGTSYSQSDADAIWDNPTYDLELDEVKVEEESIKGAIYFNKAGFNPNVHNYHVYDSSHSQDYITIRPTGSSDYDYDDHDRDGGKHKANDILEMRMFLPTIGNMVCEGYDILYGEQRNNNPQTSLMGKLESINTLSNNQIPVQYKMEGSNYGEFKGLEAYGDTWINPVISAYNGRFDITHNTYTITSTIKDDTNLDGVGEFTVQDLIFDAAGHVTANQKHKYTLPYNIRNVAVTVADTTNIGSNQVGTTQADSYNDTLNLSTQNRWINLSVNDVNDTISIGHAAAGDASVSANLLANNNLIPKFGEKFKVLTAGIDQTGHVKDLSDYEITLPQPSLNDLTATEASVLTGISMIDSTGAITQTNANVGTLKLTGYTAVKTNDDTYVQASHTINQAFNKVDTRLDAEINRADAAEDALNKRIDDLDVSDNPNLNQVVYKVEQTDGKIVVTHENVGNLTLAGYTLPESVSTLALNAGNTLNTALGKLEYRLNAEVSRATTEEGKLSTAISNETSRAEGQEVAIRGEFAAADTTLTNNLNNEIDRAKKAEGDLTTALNNEISRAKAEEEKINGRIDAVLGGVTEEELNTFKELSDALADDANFASTVNNAIAGVQSNLNAEISNRETADNEIKQNLTNNYLTSTAIAENYLSKTDASAIYQTIIPEGTYVIPTALEDYVLKSEYDAKIAELTALIEGLTERIAVLEGYHTATEETPSETT